jgi:hypothetical protein
MPDLLTLPLRAAGLTIRTTRWAVGQLLERLLPGEDEAPVAARPSAPPPPQDDPPRPASKRRAPAKKPSVKQARRAARHEPTRGQAAAIREAEREAEQNAGGPGPGATIEVAEPWDGYETMTEDEVLERLVGADPALRAIVRLYESTHGERRQVIIATEEVTVEP